MTAVAAPAIVPKQSLSVLRGPQGIWSHVRKRWLVETPEERVRQEYLCTLVNEYGYDLEQIAEEVSVTGRGSAAARADFLIWRSVAERAEGKPAFIVVECTQSASERVKRSSGGASPGAAAFARASDSAVIVLPDMIHYGMTKTAQLAISDDLRRPRVVPASL